MESDIPFGELGSLTRRKGLFVRTTTTTTERRKKWRKKPRQSPWMKTAGGFSWNYSE